MKSAKELAQENMPTPERMAKGDITTFGLAEWNPDVKSDRATTPTAQTAEAKQRPYRCNLARLVSQSIITDEEATDCKTYAYLHEAWQVSIYPKAIDMAKERVDGSSLELSHLDKAQQYLWILGRLSPEARLWMQYVVLDGLPIYGARSMISGGNNSATRRFQKAVAELSDSISAMLSLSA